MFALSIAKRFITHNKTQSFFIVLGIAVGVAVQIFVGILIDSLQANLIDKTVGSSPHLVISNNVDTANLNRFADLETQLKADTRVTKFTATATGNVFVLTPDKGYPALIQGVEFTSSQNDVFGFQKNLMSGTLPATASDALIGQDLLNSLKTHIGQLINVADAQGNKHTLKITGVVDTGVLSVNQTLLVTDLKTAQDFFGYGNDAASVVVQVKDVFNVEKVASSLPTSLAGQQLLVKTWKQTNAQLLSALGGQSSSSLMIQIFVLLSVVIAIASVLSITVMQKSRQIGILKAMGISDRDAIWVFLIQAFMLGILGASLGLAFGFGLFGSFITFAKTADGSPIVTPYIRTIFVSLTWLIAVVAATFAGVLPARKSSALNPIEIIRNG